MEDGCGVVGVSTSLHESVDHPGAEAVEYIRVGTYVLVSFSPRKETSGAR